jgi:hypothetical protein
VTEQRISQFLKHLYTQVARNASFLNLSRLSFFHILSIIAERLEQLITLRCSTSHSATANPLP